MTAAQIKRLARECGFELAGHRARRAFARRQPPLSGLGGSWNGGRHGLPHRSPRTRSHRSQASAPDRALHHLRRQTLQRRPSRDPARLTRRRPWLDFALRLGRRLSRVLRRGLEQLAAKLGPDHEYKICVDTAPLLERSYARQAGLGWIGKNTCLINQEIGSWVFLGEILLRSTIEHGLRRRPIAAEPARAASTLVPPRPSLRTAMKSTPGAAFRTSLSNCTARRPRRCAPGIGQHVFGCDICQDVCPWNSRAPVAQEPAFEPRHFAPPLEELAAMTEDEFRSKFSRQPRPARANTQAFCATSPSPWATAAWKNSASRWNAWRVSKPPGRGTGALGAGPIELNARSNSQANQLWLDRLFSGLPNRFKSFGGGGSSKATSGRQRRRAAPCGVLAHRSPSRREGAFAPPGFDEDRMPDHQRKIACTQRRYIPHPLDQHNKNAVPVRGLNAPTEHRIVKM